MTDARYANGQAEAQYRRLLENPSDFPISFVYGDRAYKGFGGADFKPVSRERVCEGTKERRTVVYGMADGLCARVETAYYPSHGAYEWTVWFENKGASDSKVIHSLIAADMVFAGDAPVLKGILGDHENMYRPYVHDLRAGEQAFVSRGGRPTHVYFPYFNLEHGDGGTLIAIGWGGTWEASFRYLGGNQTAFSGTGGRGLCTYLKPGERIRTALVAVLPYAVRDEDHATNLWRSWFIQCNMPRQNARGDAIAPFSTTCLACDTGLPNADGSISERHFTWRPSMERMLAEGIRPDYRWFDAGWYPDAEGNTVQSDWWGTVGVWQLDGEKWPGNSFRASVDYAHERGIRTLVWFEPERVTHVDALVKNHGYRPEWAIPDGDGGIANNIGDPACLAWTLERITRMLRENDVDMYREDNNLSHAGCWAAKDAMEGEGRRGITENKCVQGHYALWDGIIAAQRAAGRDTFVDSCASGGGRNDLESMRRGIPVLRSDSDRTTTALRLSMTTSFNRWIPMCGAHTSEQAGQLDPDGKRDTYIFRASINPILNFSAQWVQDPSTDFDMLRFGLAEWDKLKAYTLKDFYLLTPWNGPEERRNWTAYMYHDPQRDSGALLIFRMEEAAQADCTVSLRMLAPEKRYMVADFDAAQSRTAQGEDLIRGFTVSLPAPRSAAVFEISAIG